MHGPASQGRDVTGRCQARHAISHCWAKVYEVHNYSSAFLIAFLGAFLEAARAVTRLGVLSPPDSFLSSAVTARLRLTLALAH